MDRARDSERKRKAESECDPHFTRENHIMTGEGQEITFDLFEILLNYCVFLIFLKFPKILKNTYWLRYITFKVEDMRLTKELRT